MSPDDLKTKIAVILTQVGGEPLIYNTSLGFFNPLDVVNVIAEPGQAEVIYEPLLLLRTQGIWRVKSWPLALADRAELAGFQVHDAPAVKVGSRGQLRGERRLCPLRPNPTNLSLWAFWEGRSWSKQ